MVLIVSYRKKIFDDKEKRNMIDGKKVKFSSNFETQKNKNKNHDHNKILPTVAE
jgi:hypothetical protein